MLEFASGYKSKVSRLEISYYKSRVDDDNGVSKTWVTFKVNRDNGKSGYLCIELQTS